MTRTTTSASAPRRLRVSFLGLRAVIGAQGGIETHVRDVVAGLLAEHGDEVDLEVMERQPYVPADRVLPGWAAPLRLTGFWSPRQTGLEAIVHTFLGVLRAGVRRPDILHIHGIGPALMTPLARVLGLRVVVTHHGQDYEREKWGRFARRMLQLGERMAARFATECIVIAPSLDQKLMAMFGRRFEYIPNAAPALRPDARTDVLERFGLSPGRYVVHVGRFVPEKRQLDLIAAFAQVARPGWKLVLVGGNDHPSPYERQVREAAQAQPGVVLTGVLGAAQITQLLQHTGLFALPSTHEGLPIALLEAMTCGAPVLVSALPSLTALNLPPRCYVRPAAVPVLAECMAAQMKAAEDGGAAPVDWSEWLQPFSRPAVAERTLQVYRRATREPAGLRARA